MKTYRIKAQSGVYGYTCASGVKSVDEGTLSSGKRWRLWVVRKGSGTNVVSEYSREGHENLMRKRDANGEIEGVKTKSTKYKLKV